MSDLRLWEPCPVCVEIGNLAAKDDKARYRHARLCHEGCKHGGSVHPGGREIVLRKTKGIVHTDETYEDGYPKAQAQAVYVEVDDE